MKILSLERHSDVLHSADCSSDSIALKFHTADQFRDVQTAWSWVNDDDAHRIMLVTDNSDCNVDDGDPTIRQPWVVNAIQFDVASELVFLAAEPITWEAAFQDQWRVQGGSRPIVKDAPRMAMPLTKRVDFAGTPKVQLAHNVDGISINVPKVPVTLTCDPCHTTGELDFDYDIVPWLLPQPHLGGVFQVYGNNIGAEIAAKLTANAKLVNETYHDVIYDIPLPKAGLGIPNLFALGFNLKLELAGAVSVDASTSMTAGISVQIPDNSTYVLNFDDRSKDQNSGWQPTFSPILDLSGNVGVHASIGPQLSLELDAQMLSFGGSLGLALAGPQLQADATVIADSHGVCDKPDAEAGFEVDLKLHIDLHAFESANIGFAKPAATQTIVAGDLNLFTTCVPLSTGTPAPLVLGNSSIDGLAPTANNASTTWVTETAHVTLYGSA